MKQSRTTQVITISLALALAVVAALVLLSSSKASGVPAWSPAVSAAEQPVGSVG